MKYATNAVSVSVPAALHLIRQGQWAAAEKMLRTLASGGDVQAVELLGKICLQAHRTAEAVQWFRKALSFGETSERLNDMGVALVLNGARDPAGRCYQRAMTLDPAAPAPLCNLGRLLFSEGKKHEAVPLLRKSVACDDTYCPGYLYLGIALLGTGDAAGAIAALERAVALGPKNPMSHCYLAKALHQQGNIPAAIKACQQALAVQPGDLMTLAELGMLWFGQGRLSQALGCFQQYLARVPGSGEAHNNCGLVLQQMGRRDEAIRHFRTALNGPHRFPPAAINLGSTLHLSGQWQEAEATFKQACALAPDDPHAFAGLADIEQSIGNAPAAFQAFIRAIELEPENPEYYRRLVSLGKKWPLPAALRAHLLDMQTHEDRLSDRDRSELHFALYRLCLQEDLHDDAIRHLLTANAARRRTLRYNTRGVTQLVARISADTPAGLFGRKAGLGEPSDLPVFIVGMPRCGSTLLEQILSAHPDICGPGELTDFSEVVHPRPDDVPETDISHLSGEDMRILARRYLKALKAYAPDARRIINKLPWNFFLVGYIHLLLPHARIIHMQRDPVDCCFSCFEQDFRGSLDFSYDQAELGHYYRAYEAMMAHWRAVLPAGTLCEISYEALIGNPEAEVRRVLAYCGVDWDPACLNFYQSDRAVLTASVMQVRQPLYASSVGKWKRYAEALAPLRRALSGDAA